MDEPSIEEKLKLDGILIEEIEKFRVILLANPPCVTKGIVIMSEDTFEDLTKVSQPSAE